jgi:hypothetical protein
MAQTLDPTAPADTDLLSSGAGQIRDLKQAIIDIMGVTHVVVTGAGLATGKALTSHSWHDALFHWNSMRSG